MSDFIMSFENAASPELCQLLIDKHLELQQGSHNQAFYGEMDNGGVHLRRDISYFFDRIVPELAMDVNAILDQFLPLYMDEYPSIAMRAVHSSTVKVQETHPRGGFHAWHCEDSSGASAGRELAWTLYLNTLPEGEGETEFLEQSLRVRPEQGKLVFWPSAWTHTHRGNPPQTTTKYIATGWYYLAE